MLFLLMQRLYEVSGTLALHQPYHRVPAPYPLYRVSLPSRGGSAESGKAGRSEEEVFFLKKKKTKKLKH